MTILVTAASGHLGRLTVHALLERGVDPAGLVATARDTASIADLAERGVTTRRLDYDDAASLGPALEGVETLLLVSGAELGKRLDQHTRVVEAALAAGVGRLVYTSAPQADTADYPLAAEHAATEAVLAGSGLRTTILRNGWYHENYTGQLATTLEHGAVLGSAGAGRVSGAARGDLAEAAAVVLTAEGHDGQVHELGGTPFTLAEYAALVARESGREVRYVDLPAEEYAAALTGAGVPAPMAEVLAACDLGLARGELLDESGTLERILGRPTTPLVDSIRAALA